MFLIGTIGFEPAIPAVWRLTTS